MRAPATPSNSSLQTRVQVVGEGVDITEDVDVQASEAPITSAKAAPRNPCCSTNRSTTAD